MTEILAPQRRPHDEFFKSMMFEEPVAKDFFKGNFPIELLTLIKPDTMILEFGDLVDKELRMLHTDILYKVELKEGGEGYIFILVEHYSTPDPTMAFRTLNYVMRILDKHVKKCNNADKNPLPLPYVFPIVYYNGERAFKGERCLFNLFGEYKEQVEKIFNGPLHLIDVSVEADSDISGQKWASLLSWCMRHSMQREFLSHLPQLGQYAEEVMLDSGWAEEDRNRIKTMINYMLRSLNTTADRDALIEAVYNILPSEMGDTMATFAERVFEEGKIEGKQETVAWTLKAINFIKAGWDNVAISEITNLELSDIEKLRKEIMY